MSKLKFVVSPTNMMNRAIAGISMMQVVNLICFLNFTFSHDLHDWDLKSEFKLEPRLVNSSDGRKYYDFNPYFTLSVVWRQMESMKT